MDFVVIFGLSAMGLSAYVLVGVFAKLPAMQLRWKLSRLGDVAGLTRHEVTAALGPPSCVTLDSAGKDLFQWIVNGYHIVLRFDGNTCEKISHEIVD